MHDFLHGLLSTTTNVIATCIH